MPLKKKAKKFIEYIFARAAIFWFGLIPFRLRAHILARLCLLLGRVKGVRRRLEDNINLAYGDRDEEFRKKLRRETLENLGWFAAEFIQTKRINEKFLLKHTVMPDAEKFTRDALKGGVYVVGHLGNWEIFAAIAAYYMKRPMYALIKRQSNMFMDKFIVKTRHRFGMATVYTDEHPMKTLKLLKKGVSMAFAADQNAGDDGLLVPFFSKFASTYTGPAIYARAANAYTCFGTCYRDEKKRLVYETHELPKPDIDPKENPEEWDRQFTATWVRMLEKHIRERPQDYFWLHNRWKTQPSAEKEKELRKLWNFE